MSRKLKIPKEEYQKVIDIYLSGKSIPETANYFNVSIEFLLGMEEKDNKNSLAYRLEKLNREKKELEILILESQK